MKHALQFVTLPLAFWVGQASLTGSVSLAQSGMETLEDVAYWQNLCQLQTQAGNPEAGLSACEQAIALEPENANLWADYGFALLSLEQYPETLAAVDRALNLNEQNSLALTYQCMAYLGMDLPEKALDTCDAALQTNSFWGNQSPTLVWRTRGQILHQMGQPQQALIAYDRALQLEPNESVTLAYRCQTLVETGEYMHGITACQAALAGDGNWLGETPALTWGYQGQAHTQLGDYAKAIDAYDRAVALEPENAEHWLQQGWLLEQIEEFAAAALSYTRAVELTPESSRGLVGQCRTLNQQTQFEAAQAACEQALAGNGDWWPLGAAQAWRELAHAKAGLGEYESALAAINRAVGIHPDYLQAQSDRSVILWYLADYESAAEVANRIVNPELTPVTEENQAIIVNSWTNLGRIYSSLEQPQLAINAYEQAITLNGQNSETWANLSAAYWLDEQYTEALNAAEQSITLNWQSEQGWQNQGAAQAALGLYSQAQLSYEQSLEINNQNADVWAGLGAVQLRLGDADAAMESLEIAIQLNPHQVLVQQILEAIAKASSEE
ncbi:MAG: tetratricopeptide repeat protein [Cyanobacteria bacterium P01_F01_bin.56]